MVFYELNELSSVSLRYFALVLPEAAGAGLDVVRKRAWRGSRHRFGEVSGFGSTLLLLCIAVSDLQVMGIGEF